MDVVGKTFLDIPYVTKRLGIGKTESLMAKLLVLNCTTFVENALVFSQLLKNLQLGFKDFTQVLKTIRYKDDELDSYASRLHYLSAWIGNNESKGLLKDITNDIGVKQITKTINFMGTYHNLYSFFER
jgi:hypothetical protein